MNYRKALTAIAAAAMVCAAGCEYRKAIQPCENLDYEQTTIQLMNEKRYSLQNKLVDFTGELDYVDNSTARLSKYTGTFMTLRLSSEDSKIKAHARRLVDDESKKRAVTIQMFELLEAELDSMKGKKIGIQGKLEGDSVRIYRIYNGEESLYTLQDKKICAAAGQKTETMTGYITDVLDAKKDYDSLSILRFTTDLDKQNQKDIIIMFPDKTEKSFSQYDGRTKVEIKTRKTDKSPFMYEGLEIKTLGGEKPAAPNPEETAAPEQVKQEESAKAAPGQEHIVDLEDLAKIEAEQEGGAE